MSRSILCVTALFLCLASSAIAAETKRYLNVDRHGLALHGYDPVAYFTQSKAVKGDKNITSTYQGATYRFASQEDKETFEKDPAKYEPQFGGFCGYAVSDNHTADIDPEAFIVKDDRLILQYSKKVLKMWNQDPENRLKRADANWPGIADKNGK
jgi:YHS domain-containing protein